MSHRYPSFLILSVLILTVFTGGCTTPTGNAVGNEHQTPIRIGGLFHLSGDGAYWGTGERNAAMMAVDDINAAGGIRGRRLVMDVEDGKTDFPSTVSGLKRLIDVSGDNVIIGPTWFGQVLAPIAESGHVLVVSPSTGVTVQRERFFFNLWSTERQEVLPLVDYMQSSGIRTVTVVYTKNDWSESMKNVFLDEAARHGMTVISTYAVAPDEKDFRTIIAKIALEKPDAVYGAFAFYPAQGHFSRQAQLLQMNVSLYSTSDTEIPDLLATFPEIDATFYAYPDVGDREAQFRERYEERFGISASPSAAYAYDAVQLVARAMNDGAQTPQEISDYLSAVDGYEGMSNTITFVNGRVESKHHLVKQVRGSEYVVVH